MRSAGSLGEHDVEEDERKALSKKLQIDRELDEEEEQIEKE